MTFAARYSLRLIMSCATLQPHCNAWLLSCCSLKACLCEIHHVVNFPISPLFLMHRADNSEATSGRALDSSLLQPLLQLQSAFVLVDAHAVGQPIVHASDSFLHLTGYSWSEVEGRNCNFLQVGQSVLRCGYEEVVECNTFWWPPVHGYAVGAMSDVWLAKATSGALLWWGAPSHCRQ